MRRGKTREKRLETQTGGAGFLELGLPERNIPKGIGLARWEAQA